jgi:Ca-activated chloride channel family protein
MHTPKQLRTLMVIVLLFSLILSACAARATQLPAVKTVAVAKPVSPPESQAPAAAQEIVVEKQVIVSQHPSPTGAPASMEAPRPAVSIPASPPPAGNSFQNYGINPFQDAIEDHLSTFALDVDTASYTVARRYVMDGNLPPSDAVRVEEFVNYFDQDYANPEGVAFGLYADGAPSPFHYDGSYILRIGVQGYEVSETQRKPLALTFVIDTSGSMDMENRLGLVKQSLQMLVQRLHPNDTVAIVEYGTNARVVLNPASGEDQNYILNAIYSLQPGGTTNVEDGLRLGYQLAAQAYHPEYNNRVILLSDGVANTGATNPDQLTNMIREYANSGFTLTTVGVGMGNFNDVLLEKLADHGNGNYTYIDNLDEAERLFIDNLTTTLQTIALNAKVQVDFNPEVVDRYRLIGYENRSVADQDFRNDAVDAGEINAGHSATALYAIQMKPGSQGRLATVQLRWEDPDTHNVREINGNFNTWDLAPNFESASPRYQLAVIVAQYAEMLRRSPWAQDTNIRQLLDHAVRLAGLIPGDAAVNEFASLVSRASQISALMDR